MKKWKKIRSAGFTVEAACIMPVILLTLFGVIYLSVFVHDRAWLSSAAYESAVCGSMEGIRKNGEVRAAAEMRCHDLTAGGLIFLDGLKESVSIGSRIRVSYGAELHGIFGFFWKLSAQGEAVRMEPSDKVRETLILSGG